MSCLEVMYHQSCGARYLPAAYKAACYGHQQRKPSAYSKVQECVEQQMHQHHYHHQQQLQQSRAAGMLPRDQGLRRASLPPGSRCSVGSGASGGGGDDSQEDCVLTKDSCSQPAEAEYLSARCVLFTYFQGSIGDVVDEHFSRALSQSGAFAREPKPVLRVTQQQPAPPLPGGLWKDGASLSEGPIMNMWTSGAYPSQAGPCLPATSSSSPSSSSSSSISIHPDFPCTVSPLPFLPADGGLWPGHALAQAGLADPHSAWSYGLNAGQAGAAGGGVPGSYPQIHDLYPHHPASVHAHHHPHGHAHPHHVGRFPHAHPLHSFPSHGVAGAMDPRFAPLLLPGLRQRTSCAEAQGSPPPRPLSEGVKTEMDPGASVPTATASTLPASWSPASLHGSMEVYDSGLNQEKAKSWF